MRFEADNVYDAWRDLVEAVVLEGRRVAPRGIACRELIGTQVTAPIRSNIISSPVRDLNYRFMVAEWLWIQTGREDVNSISRYNSHIAQFSDDGEIFNGAYGPRLAKQWDYLLNLLKKDPDSRQGVAVIFSPCPGLTKDVPCTIALQVIIREGKLHSIMSMRSNDLWLGFPYDFFNFSQMSNAIAGELGVETGDLTIQAGSSHLYETNDLQVRRLLCEDSTFYVESPKLPGLCRNPNIVTNPYISGDIYEKYNNCLMVPTKYQALDILRGLV